MNRLLLIGGISVVVVVLLLPTAYYLIFGYTKINEVRDGVFQVYNENAFGRIGANMTIVETEEGLVSVDANLAPLLRSARKKIARRSNKQFNLVINTHWHPDHTGGNGLLIEEADIAAHENVKSLLASDHVGIGLTKPGSYRQYDPVSDDGLPEILVQNQQMFSVGAIEFEAVHYPAAHTNGDLVVFADQLEIVVLGDLVWPDAFPFVDVHNGGTAKGISRALNDVIQRVDAKPYSLLIGHGDPISMTMLRDYVSMIDITIDYVERQKKSGKSLEESQLEGLPDTWRSWGSKLTPEEEWIRMIYETI